MKPIGVGHHFYELENFEQADLPGQVIQFIEKQQLDPNRPEMVTVNNGTTNEEVLKMLIHRIKALQEKFPCAENMLALRKIQEALFWLEERTKGRKERGVEGQHKA